MAENENNNECFSQLSRSDDELDLPTLAKADDNDVMSQEEDSSSKHEETNSDTKMGTIACGESSKTITKCITTNEISTTKVEKNDLKSVKHNRSAYRKNQQRFRANRKSQTKQTKINHADHVDRWQHDKYEMLYGDKKTNNNNVGDISTNEIADTNVKEIKDCIVSMLHSLTLSNTTVDPNKNNDTTTSKLKSSNSLNLLKHNKSSTTTKNQKQTVSVVISDNTKKNNNEKRSPTMQSNKNRQLDTLKSLSEPPIQVLSAVPLAQSSISPQLSSNVNSNKTQSPYQTAVTFEQKYPSKDRSLPYQTRFNPKKYFRNNTYVKNNPRPFVSPYKYYSNYGEVPMTPITFQPQTNFNESLYYVDQNYYYYTHAPTYYNELQNSQYQPNVYLPAGYNPNVYYNESLQYPINYYNQPIYEEGFYYQPMAETYNPVEQPSHGGSNYNYSHSRWNTHANDQNNRVNRRQ